MQYKISVDTLLPVKDEDSIFFLCTKNAASSTSTLSLDFQSLVSCAISVGFEKL